MIRNINCIHVDNPGEYCKNKNIKKSLLGLGARCCIKYYNIFKYCKYYRIIPKPELAPPPSPDKKDTNERRKNGERRCDCNTCNEKVRIKIEISKKIAQAITDIVKENNVNVDDVIEDALLRHPLIEESMIYLKNKG